MPTGINSPTFIIKEYLNSTSGTGLLFSNDGVAISGIYKILKGSECYSFRCKREELTGRITVYVSEYDENKEFIKETLILDSTNKPKSYESVVCSQKAIHNL